jgi:hypothetical protein
MPHYEMICNSGHETEVEQRITEDPLTVCPKLGTDQDGNEVQCCSPCRRLTKEADDASL